MRSRLKFIRLRRKTKPSGLFCSIPCALIPHRTPEPRGSWPGCRWSLSTGSRCRVGSPGKTWCSAPRSAPWTPSAPSFRSVRVRFTSERAADEKRKKREKKWRTTHPSSPSAPLSSSASSSFWSESRVRQHHCTSREGCVVMVHPRRAGGGRSRGLWKCVSHYFNILSALPMWRNSRSLLIGLNLI